MRSAHHVAVPAQLVHPLFTVLPEILEIAISVRRLKLPLRRTILPQLVVRPRLQAETLEGLRHVGRGRYEGGEAVNAGQEAEQALLNEHTFRDADGTVREALIALYDPASREVEVLRRKRAEPSCPDDDDNWLHARGDMSPVVTSDLDLGVDVEGDIGESVGGERLSSLPDRNTGDDVETVIADSGEVVFGKIVNDGLKLENRGAGVATGGEIAEG